MVFLFGATYNLQQERHNVDDLQRALNAAKARYKEALSKLEAISEEIHMQRKLRLKLPPRTPGVGAERADDNSDLPSICLGLLLFKLVVSQNTAF